jgi:hypothetical protein
MFWGICALILAHPGGYPMPNLYGTAVYGSGLYGAASTPGVQPTYSGDYVYKLLINWDGSWTNEAGRCNDAQGYRGRQFYVGQSGETFEQVQPGEFTFTLDNYDARYDPYNTGSELSGHIEPGKAVKFSVKLISSGVTYDIFTGHIKDIRPTSGRQSVQVIVTDALQWLADQDITIPTGYNLKVSDAIVATLNAASYPYGYSISASNCPITYFDPQESNALDVIRELSDAGLGTIFCDHSGTLKYYDLSTTGLTTHTLDQAVLLKEITVSQPWDNVRNKITCVANRYGYSGLEEVWRFDEPVGVGAGATVTMGIEFEAARVVQPVRGVDYFCSGQYENFVPGVGWLTTNWDFTAFLTAITMTTATLNIRNNDVGFLYLNSVVIRGNKLVNKKMSYNSTDATSAANGPRRLRIDTPWLQDRGFAAAYAPLLLAHLKDPTKDPVITLDTRVDALDIELFDRLTLTSAKLGISATYDVGYIDYKWTSPNGQSFEQTLYLQHVLYSSTTIIPDPYYPQLPPVPPVVDPPAPPVSDPVTGNLSTCLQDYPTPAAANGPFSYGGGLIDNSTTSQSLQVGKWFRSIYHANRTYIEVDALWESNTGGVWSPDGTFDFTAITGYNNLGVSVATGAVSSSGTPNGVRTYQFTNIAAFVQTLKFTLAATAITTTYARQDLLDSIYLEGHSGTWIDIPGLNQGQLYCLEGRGSINFNEGGAGLWRHAAQINGGTIYSWGYIQGGSMQLPENATFLHAEACLAPLDTNNARCFFRHDTTLSVMHGDYNQSSDNSGYMYVDLYTANLTVVGDKRVTIRSIKLYNVCEGNP